ncbi:MAG: hypothetical protein OXG07_05535 [Anaerolineaceae bacterium]|nr:hypothetical protein [Anaerolineaceae bacterium]
MGEERLLREARVQALEVLHRCRTDQGFRASGAAAGYPQIWARDSVITAIGALVSGDAQLEAAARASLENLGQFQSGLGLVPLNVNPDNGYISTENAGALDANLWFILGHWMVYQVSGDMEFLLEHWPQIDRALLWLEYQDMNECGLLEVPEAGNWMDLISVRYNTLYDNVLYYAAMLGWEQMRALTGATGRCPAVTSSDIHERLNLLMWVDRCWVAEHFAEHLEQLKSIRLEWFMLYHNIGTISSRPYYLPWVAFREYGTWCDSLGNALAILTGIADGHRSEHILRYMHQVGIAEPYPTRAIYPPVYPGESDWREYYRSRNLNLPYQYHNGGIWPMVGGFHIAALVCHGWLDEAGRLLYALAESLRQAADRSLWGFNEWLHGESGNPMGFDDQAWSAALFLYADHCLQREDTLFFNELRRVKPATAVAAENNEFDIRPGGGPVHSQ